MLTAMGVLIGSDDGHELELMLGNDRAVSRSPVIRWACLSNGFS